MIDFIYLEEDVADAPVTRDILRRFAKATVVECGRYTELFNRKAQNFRIQKLHPALILAKKHNGWVLPAPSAYHIGGDHNFYFSHMLNCIYDCRYCFLQGMYRSANYVLFVNYQDFFHAIDTVQAGLDQAGYFFSGYDCDSLALEPVSRFVEHALPFFSQRPKAILELRTKSTQIRALQAADPIDNCVVAYSFTPQPVAARWEDKVPSIDKRIDAMAALQQQGWRLGLRFDPLIYTDNFEQAYTDLFQRIFARLDPKGLHSVSLGVFRMPQKFFKTLTNLYPEISLWNAPLAQKDKQVAYESTLEQTMLDFCRRRLLDYVADRQLFMCS